MMRHFREFCLVESCHHFKLPDSYKTVKAMCISTCMISFIAMQGKILKNSYSWSIVKKSLETFKNCSCKRRLLNISVEIGVGVEDKSTTEVEEKGVIVKLMVGQLHFIHPNEHKSKHYLNI